MNQPRIINVPPVSPEELGPLIVAGFDATRHIKSLEESVTPFFDEVSAKLNNRNAIDQVPLTLRAVLALFAIADCRPRFVAEGLLPRSGPGASILTAPLVAGLASAPYKVRMYDDNRFKPKYNPGDIVRDAKKFIVDSKRNGGVRLKDGVFGGIDVGPMGSMLADALEGLPEGTSLGDVLANSFDGRLWAPRSEDFPGDSELCAYRDRQMQALSPAQRRVFQADRLPDSHKTLKMISSQITIMPLELQPTMASILGIGPWSFYPMLNDKADWSYPAYRDVVLSSPLAASIPCRHGCHPAYYVARYGSIEEFSKVLSLYPAAANACDLAHRPLIVELALLDKNPTEKMTIALKFGANPNFALPSGSTAFTTSLRRKNFTGASVLLAYDYKPLEDDSFDQRVADEALSRRELDGTLRHWIAGIRNSLRPLGKISQMQEDAAETHERMFGNRPPRH